MFNRINTGGSKANEAEVRRGSLPGLITDLVVELSTNQKFIEMTPISKSLVDKREREELAVRFLAYTSKYNAGNDQQLFSDYKDRPREFIYKYLEEANKEAAGQPEIIETLKAEFIQTLDFVARTYPNGFLKPSLAKQIPRARYEAIAIGSALAIRQSPELLNNPPQIDDWIDNEEFTAAITSDGANTRAKLEGRIKFVMNNLLEAI
jgi:hypothetical protein